MLKKCQKQQVCCLLNVILINCFEIIEEVIKLFTSKDNVKMI